MPGTSALAGIGECSYPSPLGTSTSIRRSDPFIVRVDDVGRLRLLHLSD
jgi:hypothetical protein